MKYTRYMIAASAPQLDAKVAKRFGHAGYYLVIDPETMEFETVADSVEGQPSQSIHRFESKGVSGIIVGNIGPNAFDKVRGMGWEVYSCIGMIIRDAVEKVHKGEIKPLEAPTMKVSVHEGRTHGGGGGKGQGGRQGGTFY